jgi:hypothetical protein
MLRQEDLEFKASLGYIARRRRRRKRDKGRGVGRGR